jgi:hypothetical protein
VAAAQAGDLAALEKLFSEDVVSYSDSNGRVRAAGRPLFGAATIAKIFAGWAPKFWEGADVSYVDANGLSAVRLRKDGTTYAVITVTASSEGIDQVMWLVNPEKLNAFQ